jgi:acetolactate synthase I/II/III large subunit
MPRAGRTYVAESDVVFGVGASFTATGFGIRFPTKDKPSSTTRSSRSTSTRTSRRSTPLLGDSKLALGMLHEALKDRLKKPRGLTKVRSTREHQS